MGGSEGGGVGGRGRCSSCDTAVMGEDCKFHPHFTCSIVARFGWLGCPLKKTHVATLGKRRSSNILQRLAGFFSPLGNESQLEETELRSQTAEALSIILYNTHNNLL